LERKAKISEIYIIWFGFASFYPDIESLSGRGEVTVSGSDSLDQIQLNIWAIDARFAHLK
jgi:hypothetical protein